MTTRRDLMRLVAGSLAASVTGVGTAGAQTLRIRRDGHLLMRGDQRFVINGVSQYAFNGDWQAPADGYFIHRALIYDRFRELGINTQRLAFWAASYAKGIPSLNARQQRERLRLLCEDAAVRGIYTIIGLWDAMGQKTDEDMRKAREVGFAALRDILEIPGIRDNPHVLIEPWNEPGPTEGETWIRHTEATIRFLRSIGYDGVILVDTPWWSWAFRSTLDSGDIDRALAVDDNICFCNHRYPKGDADRDYGYTGEDRRDHVEEVMQFVGRYPIFGSEYGWHAHLDGVGQNHPRWMSQLLEHLVDVDIPAGLNGLCLWKWKWSTDTLTTFDDYSADGMRTLTAYGELANARLWSKLKA